MLGRLKWIFEGSGVRHRKVLGERSRSMLWLEDSSMLARLDLSHINVSERWLLVITRMLVSHSVARTVLRRHEII